MPINSDHLRIHIIRPTLKHLNLWSSSAENLLLGTAAQESHMGSYLVQLDNGPARGIYQMEMATYADIWNNYLIHRKNEVLMNKVLELVPQPFIGEKQLISNLQYATAMCRIHYLRKRDPLPEEDDIQGLGNYWKIHYNSIYGKGTVDEFVQNYIRYVK